MKLYFKTVKEVFELHKLLNWKRPTMWTSRTVSEMHNKGIRFRDCHFYRNTKDKAWLSFHCLHHSISFSMGKTCRSAFNLCFKLLFLFIKVLMLQHEFCLWKLLTVYVLNPGVHIKAVKILLWHNVKDTQPKQLTKKWTTKVF